MGKETYKANKEAYIKAYNKRHYRSLNVMFRMDDPEQVECWEWLGTRYSKAGFLRDLALAAFRNSKK